MKSTARPRCIGRCAPTIWRPRSCCSPRARSADVANRYGVTPLWLAAANGNAVLVEALLKAGADANTAMPQGETVLMTAARAGNPGAVQALLARGADVNAKEDGLGETALMWAAAENRAEAARLLIAHGAPVNGRSKELTYEKDRFGLEGVLTILPRGNWTPLMYAARQGAVDAARVLAEAGADLNLTDFEGTTALVRAIVNWHYDVAGVLLEKGADPNIADTTGMAALYAVVDMNTLGEIYGRPARKLSDTLDALDLVKMLLAHGAKPNAVLTGATVQKNHTPGDGALAAGATPLMRAAKGGDYRLMRALLDGGRRSGADSEEPCDRADARVGTGPRHRRVPEGRRHGSRFVRVGEVAGRARRGRQRVERRRPDGAAFCRAVGRQPGQIPRGEGRHAGRQGQARPHAAGRRARRRRARARWRTRSRTRQHRGAAASLDGRHREEPAGPVRNRTTAETAENSDLASFRVVFRSADADTVQ